MLFEHQNYALRPSSAFTNEAGEARAATVSAKKSTAPRLYRGAFRPNSATRSGKKGRFVTPMLLNKDVTSLHMKSKLNRFKKLEKESLYESNIALKTDYNRLKEENQKLKAMN
jgi:hypothetical protein